MGISGLLGYLRSIQRPSHLTDFRGKRVAIDAYGWLHRGAIACALELVTGRPTRKYVDFAMTRVQMLLHFGLVPYLVFDGDRLPSKAATEADRHARRMESKTSTLELQRLDRKAQAYKESQKAVDVTPEMARLLIEELKQDGIDYVVAPYEADSQMVYLERKGLVDAIISEDSDLLVFGARCLITKLDQYGECMVIRRTDFASCREMNLTNWTDAEFRCMAILSGCDYLHGIPRMGIKTAHRLVRKYKTIDRIVRGMQWDGNFKIPPDYLQSYDQAEKTFLYQWVYCPQEQRLVHFNPPEPDITSMIMTYIGGFVDDEVSRKVASGELHPMTKATLDTPANLLNGSRRRLPSQSAKAVQIEADAKGNQSIKDFVSRKRTPLAELDPNTLRLSDHQQTVLNAPNNGRPWTSDPAPSRPAVTAVAQAVSRRPLQTAHSLNTPSTRQVKRQRLCADDPESPSKRGLSSYPLQSPFFNKPVSDTQGPTPRSIHTKRQQKPSDFQLWSDDSLDEFPKQLTKQEHSRPRTIAKQKRVAVFKDDTCTEAKPKPDMSKWSLLGGPGPERTASGKSCLGMKQTVNNNGDTCIYADDRGPLQYPKAPDTVVVVESPPSRGNIAETTLAGKGVSSSPKPLLGTLSRVSFKGSEDTIIPESDAGSTSESKSPGKDSSLASEPSTPTSDQVVLRRRHILKLEDFVYAGNGPVLGAQERE